MNILVTDNNLDLIQVKKMLNKQNPHSLTTSTEQITK